MYCDAHFHADDLLALPTQTAGDQGSRLDFFRNQLGLASCHDPEGFHTSRRLSERYAKADGTPGFALSFGIHPQLAITDHADFLLGLLKAGSIAAIGECGFDFFGDRPERVRDRRNEARQGQVFELQLDLAKRFDRPLVLHCRKATDLLFAYSQRLAELPGLLFHGWTGPVNEAEALLRRCPRAKFSFGTGLLNGNRRAMACVARLPDTAILSESDAPWQPPRAAAEPGAGLLRPYSMPQDVVRVVAFMARLRGVDRTRLQERIQANFEEYLRS